MELWLLAGLLLADPQPVLAAGDTLAEPAASGKPAAGWAAVLADCLEERSPGRFTVLDRARDAEGPAAVASALSTLLDPLPVAVLVGVGPQPSADREAFEADLLGLIGAVRDRGPLVVLLGVVPPAEPAEDARARDRNGLLVEVARARAGVLHVDLWAEWPADQAERARLVGAGGALTDQGHARLGATACDAVLGAVPQRPALADP